jgi:hypothetical protein
MVRSLDQITKDLSKLETSTTQIDEDLKALYQDYLTVLGKAVKQQLVLAVYHLCTQAYPDEFLKLSVSQREKVQASIRKIAAQGQMQIEQLGQVMDLSSLANKLEDAVAAEFAASPSAADIMTADSAEELSEESATADHAVDTEEASPEFEAIPESAFAGSEPNAKFGEGGLFGEDPTNDPEAGDENTIAAAEDSDDSESDSASIKDAQLAAASKEASEMIRRLSTSLSLFSVFGTEPLSPVSLAKRHVLLERHLRAILQTLSSLANYLLKQANILPDLPEMVIAAAAEAEAGEVGPSTPNVLNVLVEIGSDRSTEDSDEEDENGDDDFDDDLDDDIFGEEDSDREMTHLVAVNLRLADIEFTDAHSALWRGKLQEALLKLKRLGSRYQKLQKEKARAEAEHAWRAVWFEE